MATRGSTAMQFVPSEVYDSPAPPASPALGQLWRNTAVNPNELLGWRGLSVSNARSYAASKNGGSVQIDDMADNNRNLFFQVKTIATQEAGTVSPTTPRAIGGKASVAVRRCGKNIFNPNDVQTGTIDPTTGADIIDAGYSRISHVRINPSTAYTISYTGAYASQQVRFFWYDANKALISISNTTSFTGPNTFTSPANAAFLRIRVTGTFKADTQLELGTIPTAYEPYSGTDYTLTPTATLYGLTGAEDRVNTEGYTGLYTYYDVIKSTHTLVDTGMSAGVTGYFRFRASGLPGASVPATNNIVGSIISSHFPSLSANATYLGATGVSIDTNGWIIFTVPLSVIGAIDADTSAVKLAKAKAWLDTQTMQVLYQRATTYFYPQAAVTSPVGVNGLNNVTSDGANVTVNYTGSGWETVGSVQRVTIESVSINPEEGLRVDTVVSGDGTPVSTYFNARGTKYGLFRLSDGKLLQGARVVRDGRVLGVTSGMLDPDSDGNAYIDIISRDEGGYTLTKLRWMGKSFQGSTTPHLDDLGEEENPDQAGNVAGLEAGFDTYWAWNGTSYEDVISAFVRSPGELSLSGVNGLLLGSIASHILPKDDNAFDCGSTAKRIRKYYGGSSTISTSDERLKHDIHSADPEMLRKFILALDVDWFRLNDLSEEQMIGFIAQKFRQAMRIAGMPDDYGGYVDELPDHSRLAIRYEQVVAPLVSIAKLHEQENQNRDRVIAAQDQTMKKQARIIDAQGKTLKKQELAIAKLTKRLSAMEKLLKSRN